MHDDEWSGQEHDAGDAAASAVPPPLPSHEAPRALPPPRAGDGRTTLTDEDRLMVIAAHLGPIFASFVAPLIVWAIVKDRGPSKQFVIDSARDALNFQLTMLIALFIAMGVTFVTFGLAFPLPFAIAIGSLVLEILATLAAVEGRHYRYPFTFPFLR